MKRKWLAIGIILLFVGTSIIPALAQHTEKPLPTSRGNWLYVGGFGPGNYTRIQDAIDNASSEDTIFVFNGTYSENVIINKTINLIGENKNTTIIDGGKIDYPLWIKTSFVNVSGFTVSNGSTGELQSGVLVIEKEFWQPDDPPMITNIRISNCIIKNNRCGIRLYSTHKTNVSSCLINNNSAHGIYIVASSHINIDKCEITYNGDIYTGGIVIIQDDTIGISDNISISNCSISYNFFSGIWVGETSEHVVINYNNIFENTNCGIIISESNVKIFDNHIYNNGDGEFLDAGVFIQDCCNNIVIYNNQIETNNQYGVYLLRSSSIFISGNNFIQNAHNAYFLQFSFFNRWNENYWTDWLGLGPKLIKGKLDDVLIPWVNFDWHPVQEPYDIPAVK
jgi:parallel beta-helix repeat protein